MLEHWQLLCQPSGILNYEMYAVALQLMGHSSSMKKSKRINQAAYVDGSLSARKTTDFKMRLMFESHH